jgi:hypothetical protein
MWYDETVRGLIESCVEGTLTSTTCLMMQHFIKGELCVSSLCINQAYCVLPRGLTSGYVTYVQILSEPSILLSHMW